MSRVEREVMEPRKVGFVVCDGCGREERYPLRGWLWAVLYAPRTDGLTPGVYPASRVDLEIQPKERGQWDFCSEACARRRMTTKADSWGDCTRCGKPITDGYMIGDGDGSGQRFAHPECYRGAGGNV